MHGDRARVEVESIPAQVERLRLADPYGEDEDGERFEPVAFGGGENGGRLCGGEGVVEDRAGLLGGVGERGRVARHPPVALGYGQRPA